MNKYCENKPKLCHYCDNEVLGGSNFEEHNKICGGRTVYCLTCLRYIKIKDFEKDSFYIIKPNEYKCWHRAMAWYDVAEFKEMIEKEELDYMKSNPDAI